MNGLPIQGLKGRKNIAQGKHSAALGAIAEESQALKGRKSFAFVRRDLISVALTGLESGFAWIPRALPWAIILRPFGAEEAEVAA
jgi:hypothetical protein